MIKALLGFFGGASPEERVTVVGNAIAVLTDKDGNRRLIPGRNIVGISGNKYYAQAAAQGASLFLVNGMRLGTGSVAPTNADIDVTTSINSAGAKLSIDAGYPMRSDTDANNTGRGSNIVTWRVTFSAATFSVVGVRVLALVDNTGAPTQALCHALFAAAFDKTLTDTLTVYVNHAFTGV